MLPEEERFYCYNAGLDLARRCLNGYGDDADFDKAMSYLKYSSGARLKKELIYFRIFVSRVIIKASLVKERYEPILEGLYDFFDEYWDKFNETQSAIWKYVNSISVENARLFVRERALLDILKNAQVGVSEFPLKDFMFFRELFKKNCNLHSRYLDSIISLVLMNIEERAKALKIT